MPVKRKKEIQAMGCSSELSSRNSCEPDAFDKRSAAGLVWSVPVLSKSRVCSHSGQVAVSHGGLDVSASQVETY